MFPATMPWPMTLAPTNEAIRRENRPKKNLHEEKNYRNDLGGHVRCKDSITIKKAQDFVRVGERGIELLCWRESTHPSPLVPVIKLECRSNRSAQRHFG